MSFRRHSSIVRTHTYINDIVCMIRTTDYDYDVVIVSINIIIITNQFMYKPYYQRELQIEDYLAVGEGVGGDGKIRAYKKNAYKRC